MKKIITLMAASLLCVTFAQAQRINSFTIEGVPALGPSAAFNPTNNNESKPGDLQIIYPHTADLSNVTAVYNCGSDVSMVTTPAPVDFTKVQTVKVEKNDGSSWATYDITCKRVKPASLPFDLPVGEGFSNGWDEDTEGWAAARIDKNQSIARFGGANSNLVIAFSDVPDQLIFLINAAGDINTDAIFDVEESADGVDWSMIVRFDENNIMPNGSAPLEEKMKIFDLKSTSRYVRFLFTKRVSVNVSVSEVTVSKGDDVAINSEAANKGLAYVSPETNSLILTNAAEVAKVELFNVAGQSTLVNTQPAESTSLNGLSAGVYMIRVTDSNGVVSTAKTVIR